ncbi:hypothetical protein ACT3CD_10600 [Geofilum sp. OHC36d9]|uniref:hypothetical protein n=1 Tax=Geofilum sp. OHC36d9 TaxID=3458413 RepID=UPI00403377A1
MENNPKKLKINKTIISIKPEFIHIWQKRDEISARVPPERTNDNSERPILHLEYGKNNLINLKKERA